jgi:hypothetical protein
VTYRIFAPAVEELKTRPKLKTVTSVDELGSDGKKSFSIMIENIVTYPARSLQLIIYPWSKDVAKDYISIAPAVEHDVTIDAGVVRLTLKRSLAPGQQIQVFFRENPMAIGLQTEYGDYTSVYSNSGGGGGHW